MSFLPLSWTFRAVRRLGGCHLGAAVVGGLLAIGGLQLAGETADAAVAIRADTVITPHKPIEQVQKDENGDYVPDRIGDTVRIGGRALMGTGRLPDSTGIFLQDSTAGIAVYGFARDSVQRGDSLHIRGVVQQEEGLTRLETIEGNQVDVPPRNPDPFPLTVPAAHGETYEGQLVRLEGRVVARRSNAGGEYLLLKDATEAAPAQIAVFVHNHRRDRIPLSTYEEGEEVAVTGVMSQYDFSEPYDDYYQVLPRDRTDLEKTGVLSGYFQTLIVVLVAGGLLAIIAVFTLQMAVRRRTEQLEESRARFRQLSEATFEGIILHREGEIVDVNRALTDMIGYDRDELVGCDFLTVLSKSTRDEVRDKAEDHTQEAYEAVVVRKDGSSFPAEIEEKRVDAGGDNVHVAAIRNITDQKRRERELLLAKEEAEKMARLKSSLLNNMSHELRTPVTSIIGYAELIQDEPTTDHTEYADRIRQSGLRLSRTLRSVLELAQIESGSLEVNLDDVEVRSLVQAVIDEHEALTEGKDLSITVQTTDSETVYTDRRLLHRSLSNLVHNAVKFTDEGEVCVSVTADNPGAQIRVSDTGVGIDPEFMDSLFDPFHQESEGRDRTHEGIGLGLALTKRMIDLLGGSIEVETEKGEGTVVQLDVPCLGMGEDADRRETETGMV